MPDFDVAYSSLDFNHQNKVVTDLSNCLKVPDGLHLVDLTRSLGLTIGTTLGNWAFTASSSHGNAVDDIT